MRAGTEVYFGINALTSALLRKVGTRKTLRAFEAGVFNMGEGDSVSIIRVKEVVLRVVTRPQFVECPNALFDLFESLRFNKRSTDNRGVPSSFKPKAMAAFLEGVFEELNTSDAKAVLLDSITEYGRILSGLTPERLEEVCLFLESEGWGCPASLNKASARYFRDAMRITAIALWTEPTWVSMSKSVSKLNIPGWLPEPKPRAVVRKPEPVVSAKVVATRVEDTLPVVGQEDFATQETFEDYTSVLTSLQKGRPVQVVNHRKLGPMVALCSVRYINDKNQEININASVRDGSIPRAKHVPHMSDAVREFSASFRSTYDNNASLYVRLYKLTEEFSGTTWTNRNRGDDLPNHSYWYRVRDGEVQYRPRHSGPFPKGESAQQGRASESEPIVVDFPY